MMKLSDLIQRNKETLTAQDFHQIINRFENTLFRVKTHFHQN